MTPLVQICGIDSEQTLGALKELWRKEKYTRVIVFDERVDNVVGIVNVLSIIEKETNADDTIATIMDRNVYFIPESMPVDKLLPEMLKRKSHIAVVVNEHGGTIGLVSLEDCIEEIVGEIYDEHDDDDDGYTKPEDNPDDTDAVILPRYVAEIETEENGDRYSTHEEGEHENRPSTTYAYEVDARADLGELAEFLEIDIPKSPLYESAGGWGCDIFSRIPKEGDSIIASYPIVHGASISTLAQAYSSNDETEEIDGFEILSSQKVSAPDLDDDNENDTADAGEYASKSSKVAHGVLKLRVSVLEADERRVESLRISVGDRAEQEENENKQERKRNGTGGGAKANGVLNGFVGSSVPR